MTISQQPVPPPPRNYASWLDKIVSKDWNGNDCVAANHARAELAALRERLANTEGWLATARENLVAIDAQRAEAVRERDEAKKAFAHCTYQFLTSAPAEFAAIRQERDAEIAKEDT